MSQSRHFWNIGKDGQKARSLEVQNFGRTKVWKDRSPEGQKSGRIEDQKSRSPDGQKSKSPDGQIVSRTLI